MQDDLITRSSVLNLLEQLRIDNISVNGRNIKEHINELPIAYDVSSVVSHIKRCSGGGYRDIDGDYVPPMIRTEDAIDIIERRYDNV